VSAAGFGPEPNASNPAPIGVRRLAALMASDIKLAHSVFALPFALLGAVLAGPVRGAAPAMWGSFAAKLVLVIVCMVTARTWAMLVNRLLDRDIDAENTRTSRRIFASRLVGMKAGWLAACACAAVFVLATAGFLFFGNAFPLVLAVPVLAWIAFYSLTKRFTILCHVVLGTALAASPLAAALAVRPETLLDTPTVWWLAGFVIGWVAGFDVIYALQDESFDRSRGLSSIPAKFGTRRAIVVSRIMHAAAWACLALAWMSLWPRLGLGFGVGVVAVGGLLVWEHRIVTVRGQAGLQMAFFTVNGIVSCVLGTLGIVDSLF